MTRLDRALVRIHYDIHGSGRIILLSHGYSATGRTRPDHRVP